MLENTVTSTGHRVARPSELLAKRQKGAEQIYPLRSQVMRIQASTVRFYNRRRVLVNRVRRPHIPLKMFQRTLYDLFLKRSQLGTHCEWRRVVYFIPLDRV